MGNKQLEQGDELMARGFGERLESLLDGWHEDLEDNVAKNRRVLARFIVAASGNHLQHDLKPMERMTEGGGRNEQSA